MKTSLNIDDALFRDAKKEAERRGRTISDVISDWARAGRKVIRDGNERRRWEAWRPLSLGGAPRLDLTSRSGWIDELD